MRPAKFPLPSVNLETALWNYLEDLRRFFEGRFGRHWRRALVAHGGRIGGFYKCNGPERIPSSASLHEYEAIAVKLGFRPYVGREPNPFERNSRTYWPRVYKGASRGVFAPSARPSVVDLCRDFMVHRLKEAPGSDLIDDYPIDPQPLRQAGNGICSPIPAPSGGAEILGDLVNDNVSRSRAIREGGHAKPPVSAQSSARDEESASRPSLCSLQDVSLTASCL